MVTPEMLAKLPKWAREHIHVLEMRLKEAEANKAALFSNEPTNVQYNESYNTKHYLPFDSQVSFSFGKHWTEQFKVGLNYGGLHVYTHGVALLVKPQASNSVVLIGER